MDINIGSGPDFRLQMGHELLHYNVSITCEFEGAIQKTRRFSHRSLFVIARSFIDLVLRQSTSMSNLNLKIDYGSKKVSATIEESEKKFAVIFRFQSELKTGQQMDLMRKFALLCESLNKVI